MNLQDASCEPPETVGGCQAVCITLPRDTRDTGVTHPSHICIAENIFVANTRLRYRFVHTFDRCCLSARFIFPFGLIIPLLKQRFNESHLGVRLDRKQKCTAFVFNKG